MKSRILPGQKPRRCYDSEIRISTNMTNSLYKHTYHTLVCVVYVHIILRVWLTCVHTVRLSCSSKSQSGGPETGGFSVLAEFIYENARSYFILCRICTSYSSLHCFAETETMHVQYVVSFTLAWKSLEGCYLFIFFAAFVTEITHLVFFFFSLSSDYSLSFSELVNDFS